MHNKSSLNVLVVDDDPIMVRILASFLEHMGIDHVHEAENGQRAIELLQENRIDIILSDWNMAPVSGLDLLHYVRATDATHDIPFIMITAEARRTNLDKARDCGVSRYLVKPLTFDHLQTAVGDVIKIIDSSY